MTKISRGGIFGQGGVFWFFNSGEFIPGVGNDFFFQGGGPVGGFGPRAQEGVSGGVDFWTQKLTNFDQNFSLF